MTITPPDAGRFVIAPEIIAADLVDESVLLDMRTKRYFRLNRTASMIWRAIGAGGTTSELVDAVCQRFDIEPDAARVELNKVCADLLERGLIEAPGATSPLGIS